MYRGKPLEDLEEEMEDALPHEVKGARRLYPVDIQWKPGFTMLVNLVGHGDPQVQWVPCPTEVMICPGQSICMASSDRDISNVLSAYALVYMP